MRADRRRFLKTAGATLGAVSLGPWVVRGSLAQANVIKVASIHDLSGGLDIYGRPMVDCLTYAVEEINAAGGLLGGRKVVLDAVDSASSPTTAAIAAQQLISTDHPVAADIDSNAALQVAELPYFEVAKIPTFMGAASVGTAAQM